MHYVKTFRVPDGKGGETSRGTNLYWPEPKNDLFEYNENDTIYQARREEINGTMNPGTETVFTRLWNETLSDIDNMTENYKGWRRSGKVSKA
jgi:hypothetical protein